jgi:hypothetical protein
MKRSYKKTMNLSKLCQIILLLILIKKVILLNCPLNTWACNDGIQCINATQRCNKMKYILFDITILILYKNI